MRPLAGKRPLAATFGKRRLAATRVAASGCGPVTTASGCKLAASDCKWLRACDHIEWPQVAASRCVLVVPREQSVCLQNLKKYLLFFLENSQASCLQIFVGLFPSFDSFPSSFESFLCCLTLAFSAFSIFPTLFDSFLRLIPFLLPLNLSYFV